MRSATYIGDEVGPRPRRELKPREMGSHSPAPRRDLASAGHGRAYRRGLLYISDHAAPPLYVGVHFLENSWHGSWLVVGGPPAGRDAARIKTRLPNVGRLKTALNAFQAYGVNNR